MRQHLLTFASIALAAAPAWAGDWITAPSTYTHSPKTGRRTNQYQPERESFYKPAPPVTTSTYRHIRDSLQVGGIFDNTHIVEQSGDPVRPYGEWRFPYRPFSSPYQAWGPPVPYVQTNINNRGRGYGGGYPGRGGYHPGAGPGRPDVGPGGPGVGGPGPGGPGIGGPGGGFGGRPGIGRYPIPGAPDRWAPWHDGFYPEPPRDYYRWAPERYRNFTIPDRRPAR